MSARPLDGDRKPDDDGGGGVYVIGVEPILSFENVSSNGQQRRLQRGPKRSKQQEAR